jgi:hypothetical protein
MLLPWRRLAITALAVVALLLAGERLPASEAAPSPAWATSAAKLLADLQVKPPASMAGYSRDRFGSPWKDTNRNGCDTRDDILRLDLRLVQYKAGSDCVIATGTLNDPYTGTKINFVRGVGTSSAVQIDHVVALADAWRTGARTWSAARRLHYANDPSVLLAVDGPRTRPRGTTTLPSGYPTAGASPVPTSPRRSSSRRSTDCGSVLQSMPRWQAHSRTAALIRRRRSCGHDVRDLRASRSSSVRQGLYSRWGRLRRLRASSIADECTRQKGPPPG